MAERRKSRKRKNEIASLEPKVAPDKPSKEEYSVAKWIRNNVPSKKTKFDRAHNVEYFTGSRAVDALLENSPWSSVFENRKQVSQFLDQMLRHKFFHRAKKVVISEEELNKMRGIKKKTKDPKDEKKEDKEKKEKEREKEDSKESKDTVVIKDEKDDERADDQKKSKKKPKVRLEMHMEQCFVDCNDAYVWIYEPIPVYYWFFGTLVVLGATAVCLFPLWPLTIRHGVYYLSIAAAGFLVFILALAIIRMIVFCLLWVPTLGRCHLWLLPNLTADVGFFASFWPLYQYDYYGSTSSSDKKGSKKRKRKDKDSDSEDAALIQSEEKSEETQEETQESPKEETQVEESLSNTERKDSCDSVEAEEGSEEGSESEKSNTGRDFVMV
ncbi:translocation protein SEC62 [Harpegnathos saltator]|uniref:Translocation protein SEC62 n=1 Tax=Harpegnathos saltator TaxID=610380 RepID=E2BJT5_HARSA|nr:translocation protein SEC62 [Harpegnathos saltator]EFN84060.1 Translocation protein SEC62 [Harpegnathos saltator]